MTEGARPWYLPRLDGLAVRVAAFLTVALLPLGLIALWQTRSFHQESERRVELSLLALTDQGASGVQHAIEQALGAGEALGVVADLLNDPSTCSDYLGRFVRSRDLFSFVGLLPAEGPVTCSSEGRPFALEENELRSDLMAEPYVVARAREDGSPSGQDVLIVALPVLPREGGEGGFPGYLALSIPLDQIAAMPSGDTGMEPLRLITFNADGQILTTRPAGSGDGGIEDLLPRQPGLGMDAVEAPRVFEERSAQGSRQVYTVVPIIPGLAYAMGIWSPEQAGRGFDNFGDWPLLFPFLMWATSLLVAFWAIHRLVIRRVTAIVGRIRRFGLDRSLPDRPPDPGAPHELREIEAAFRQMAEAILQDEARMEDAFRERGVLLREVHHRVKNNLQLISSIVSMQIRRLPEPRTRAILRRLQDRVLTLAAIYRSLYTSPDLTQVNAALVLRTIVEQEMRAAQDQVETTLDIEDMVLDPDKIVPLSFLAAEAVSNALARAGAAEGRPSLSVTLHRDGEHATLRIANSLAGPLAPDEKGQQGLGQHLIQAFAAQVGGPVEISHLDHLYILSVTFPATVQPAVTEPA